jgi:hypothetical protein
MTTTGKLYNRRQEMSEILAGLWPPAPKHIEAQVDALEAEREAASQDYADLLKDFRALRKAAQDVVDGLFLAVVGDYHYSQQDTDLIDALKAALEAGDE